MTNALANQIVPGRRSAAGARREDAPRPPSQAYPEKAFRNVVCDACHRKHGRESDDPEPDGEAMVLSRHGKAVQTLRKKIEGVSELFTLDAWRHGGMTELEEAELDRGSGPRSPGTQDRAGLSRPCQGDDAARICRDTQAACASLGAEAAGRTKQHRISKWRAESISKCARKTA